MYIYYKAYGYEKFVRLLLYLSLDVTPTGSLRRRRSRVPLEEDESTLMDFLRSSGHDGTRERKSWGSLGNLLFQLIHLCILIL